MELGLFDSVVFKRLRFQKCGWAVMMMAMQIAVPCPSTTDAAEFTPIGSLFFDEEPIRPTYATSISRNGKYVVGWRYTSATALPSYIWSRAEGVRFLPKISGTPPYSTVPRPLSVSNDGTTLIAPPASGDTHAHAYLWHPTTGVTKVRDGTSRAYAITPDAKIVVGARGDPAYWTADNGWTVLGDLPTATSHLPRITGTAWAVSSDGSTIVGQADYSASLSPEPYTAFRWTADDGMQELGILPRYNRSKATAVSADGSVVAGVMGWNSSGTVFRWTAGEGVEVVGVDAQGPAVMSDDGEVVAWTGYGGPSFLTSAKVWTARHGVQKLQDILIDVGVDMGGWNLLTVTGVSGDGRTFVGTAMNSRRDQHAYLAVLPIPEPSTASLVAICISTLFTTRKRLHYARFENSQ